MIHNDLKIDYEKEKITFLVVEAKHLLCFLGHDRSHDHSCKKFHSVEILSTERPSSSIFDAWTTLPCQIDCGPDEPFLEVDISSLRHFWPDRSS